MSVRGACGTRQRRDDVSLALFGGLGFEFRVSTALRPLKVEPRIVSGNCGLTPGVGTGGRLPCPSVEGPFGWVRHHPQLGEFFPSWISAGSMCQSRSSHPGGFRFQLSRTGTLEATLGMRWPIKAMASMGSGSPALIVQAIRLTLHPGNATGNLALPEGVRTDELIGDKAYDTSTARDVPALAGVAATILSKANRKVQLRHDPAPTGPGTRGRTSLPSGPGQVPRVGWSYNQAGLALRMQESAEGLRQPEQSALPLPLHLRMPGKAGNSHSGGWGSPGEVPSWNALRALRFRQAVSFARSLRPWACPGHVSPG